MKIMRNRNALIGGDLLRPIELCGDPPAGDVTDLLPIAVLVGSWGLGDKGILTMVLFPRQNLIPTSPHRVLFIVAFCLEFYIFCSEVICAGLQLLSYLKINLHKISTRATGKALR